MTGNKHTLAEYEAAKNEPVELVPQVSAAWKAPHFVWQVRRELGAMYCPDTPSDCPEVDTAGLKVISTLDWTMQKATEKWVYVAARAPNAKDPSALLASRKIPKSARSWILGLRGHDIANAAAAVEDYRTGEILAYAGSASYTSKRQQAVPAQVRRPGRRLAPARIGHQADQLRHRHRRQDADRRDDAHGRHHELRWQLHPDPGRQVRTRSRPAPLGAPVLAQHPGHQGHDHERPRPRLRAESRVRPELPEHRPAGPLDGHRDARGPPDRPARRVRHPRQQRRPDAAPGHRHDRRHERTGRLADAREHAEGRPGSSAPGPPSSSPTSWPATPTSGSTRSGASGRSTTAASAGRPPTRRARPATTATWRPTATSPRRPTRRRRPSRSASGWATATTRPNDGKLSLDTSAPLWSAILTEVTKGTKIAQFKRPAQGLVTRQGRRLHRSQARSVLEPDGHRVLPARAPSRVRKETVRVADSVDSASGLLWRDGCAGPRVTRGYFNLSDVESNYPNWQKANANWGARAARGVGRRWRTEGHADLVLLQRGVRAVRTDLGRALRADQALPALHATAARVRPVRAADPGARSPAAHLRPGRRRRRPKATPKPHETPKPRPTKKP